jgi:predicted dehydrogenase
MEIYGSEGTLVATGEDSPQLSEVSLHAAKRGNTLAPMAVPERFTVAAPGTPSGEAANVGQMYALFAQSIRDGAIRDGAIRDGAIRDGAIRDGKIRQPNFATAVDLHRLVDAIKEASDTGREATFE